MLRHFHPQRKGAYTVWGRQNEERKRNLGYRVDYILLAEPRQSQTLKVSTHSLRNASLGNPNLKKSLQVVILESLEIPGRRLGFESCGGELM